MASYIVFPRAVVAARAVAFCSLRVARLVWAARPARSATPASHVAESGRSAIIHLVACHLIFAI